MKKRIIKQQNEINDIYLYNHNQQGNYEIRNQQLQTELNNLDYNSTTCMLCIESSYNRYFRNRNVNNLKYIGQFGDLRSAYDEIFNGYRGLQDIDVIIRDGKLYVNCYHHDGMQTFVIIQLNQQGAELLYSAQYDSNISDEQFNELLIKLTTTYKEPIGSSLYRQSIKNKNIYPKKSIIKQDMDEQFEETYVNGFTRDFSIADKFGKRAILDTFKRAFNQWKFNYKYLTGLVVALNWKIWQHYNNGNQDFAQLYNTLWQQADGYACNNLTGQELSQFYRLTD